MLVSASLLTGVADTPLFAFCHSWCTIFNVVLPSFPFCANPVTGTNGNDDLHEKLKMFYKTAVQRVAPLHAWYRITLIIRYLVLPQKIQKYIFSRKKHCEYPWDSVQISRGLLERNLDFCHLLQLCSCINDPENGLTLPLIRANNSLLLKEPGLGMSRVPPALGLVSAQPQGKSVHWPDPAENSSVKKKNTCFFH